MNERELLRVVVRAAAAHVKAEADYDSFRFRLKFRAEDEWTPAEVEELHRLSLAGVDRYQELVRALDQLAEVSPDLVNG